jgi:hypothetical protein
MLNAKVGCVKEHGEHKAIREWHELTRIVSRQRTQKNAKKFNRR